MPIKIWGLTGFSGSGKSTALKYLADEGYPVCDSDELAAEILDPKTPERAANLTELKSVVGPQAVLGPNGPNRVYLRKIICENGAERKAFETWIFPKIIAKFELLKAEWEKAEHSLGFLEGSRLVESGYVANLAGLIVVKAQKDIRKKRLVDGRGLTPEEADALIESQDTKLSDKQADFIWDNSMNEKGLIGQIEVFLMVSDPNS
jgi:dephospho-CoA kinase